MPLMTRYVDMAPWYMLYSNSKVLESRCSPLHMLSDTWDENGVGKCTLNI